MTKASGFLRVVASAGLGLLALGGPAMAGDHADDGKGKSRDARLEARLDGNLKKDVRLAEKVDAQVRKGKVTLTGSVDTEADKVRAEQLARTSGAKAVDNQVAVSEASAAPAEDRGQTRALSDPKRKDPLVGAMPAEQTGSRELTLRTLGMEDPKLVRQREQQKKEQEKQQQDQQKPEPQK